MVPCKATLAILVNDNRRPVEIAVMAGPRILAKVPIKDLFAIVAQLELLGRRDDDEQE